MSAPRHVFPSLSVGVSNGATVDQARPGGRVGSAFADPFLFPDTRPTPQTGAAVHFADVGSSGGGGGVAETVSRAEYDRVVANERALAANVETLKALALHLAAQLRQANEEVRLLQQSNKPPGRPSPHFNLDTAAAQTGAVAGGGAPTLATSDTSWSVLADALDRKEAVVASLQQQLTENESHFRDTLESALKQKNTLIATLALQLDDARMHQRQRQRHNR
ncbi:hypothetical protein NESM_000312800 [Novymonas esmeraldas]|uniref:Uncharacterized protein n=1 Tax=Novymonas esmeraldas TaxID=1808958 RepID=A0AAW0EIN8_9TRYP